MNRKKRHLFQDLALLAISIGLAVMAVKIGLVHRLVGSLDGWQWLGVIIAGMFFTSVFTTAPSIAVLSAFAATTPLPILAVLGGLGAMLGDYVIFRLVKDRMLKDFNYLLSFSKRKRFFAIFKTRMFRSFMPFIGALVIASPLPDEIGIAMLGFSKMKDRPFFLLSFIMNGAGIFVIGWLARSVAGL